MSSFNPVPASAMTWERNVLGSEVTRLRTDGADADETEVGLTRTELQSANRGNLKRRFHIRLSRWNVG